MTPTKTTQDITLEDVQDLFDSVIFLRGEEYFDEGAVRAIEAIDTVTITGAVQGSEEYAVTISIDEDGEILCDCTCPCDFDCKHAAALLLKWLSVKNKYKTLKEGTALPQQSLVQLLNAKGKEELIELLQASFERHPELRSLVQINKKELLSKIKGLFSEFWEWNEVRELIQQLEIILEGIQRNKARWDKDLLNEMEMCSTIMRKNRESVHDEGDLELYWEDWFLTFGEVFSSTKPSKEQKNEFIRKVVSWIKDDDDYGNENGFGKALVGMCSSSEDIALIQKVLPKLYEEEEERKGFLLEIYDRLKLTDQYLKTAKETGNILAIIDKLISLNKWEEALSACKENKNTDPIWSAVENRKIDLLKKLGRKEELRKALVHLIKKTGEFSYVPRLKAECSAVEWAKYLKDLLMDAEKKGRNSFLSRIYYQESNFKKAYEYTTDLRDATYLELLAKKLSLQHPELACILFRKLCFNFIKTGSGWPYQKAGKMLEAIKKIDKNGTYFRKTKVEVIAEHKKKYSLMEIIQRL